MSRFPNLTPLAVLVVAALATVSRPEAARAESYAVDAVHSSVLFRIKHMQTSYAWGRFNDISGTIDLEGPSPALNVELKVDSIDTASEKRDQHLRGPDFFNAKQFPTISFASNKITKTAPDRYEVEGTLTLHGVSKPITVEVEHTGTNRGLMGKITGLTAQFKIKRSDYGMKFMVGPLADEVLLIVSLEGAAQ